MESSEAFIQLLDKYLTQTITAEEQAVFFVLIQSKKYVPELEAVVAEALGDAAFDVNEDPVLRDILFERIRKQRENPVRQIPRYRRWGWAAAILLLIGGAVYFFSTINKHENPVVTERPGNNNGIQPGTNKALLTLSDGTIIALDSAANGTIAHQGNAAVIRQPNGGIRYEVKGNANEKVVMNSMTTPNGGQFNLELPDGSKIWLNAASSITYPTTFTGNKRSIRISGEVYMEIAKDKGRPFLVDVDGKSIVQVLGTRFNINSYANEGTIRTTLIEGIVRVSNTVRIGQGHEITLKPGQQALIAGNAKEIQVQPANIDHVLAWKNGFINFESVSLQEIMRQIERWYDVDVKLEGSISSLSIGGRMDRGVQLTDLMQSLNSFGIRSRLEGRTLIISGIN